MSNIIKKEDFKAIKPQFTELVDEKTFTKEVSFAMQHLGKNNYLNSSTTESKLKAVLNVAQVGLTLNPILKLAYLVPRREGSNVVCCLEPSYQGLVKLITDTGSAQNVYAHVVYEGDEFEEILGTSTELIHKPKRQSKLVTHVYAVAILHNGAKQVEVMTDAEVQEIKEKSESYKAFKSGRIKSCIWEDHYGEMCRKTVIRRLCKYLPKTERWEKLGTAISLDESDFKLSDGQYDLIESLMGTSVLGQEHREALELELETMSSSRASDVIKTLRFEQRDPIESGAGYGQKEIHKKLDDMGL